MAPRAVWLPAALALLAVQPILAGALDERLGRSEVRVRSAAYPLVAGRTVEQIALATRLERAGYTRVRRRPDKPGEFFWGHERFWIYRRAHRLGGRDHEAVLFGLGLSKDGKIVTLLDSDGAERRTVDGPSWLEPETLSESLDGDRASRRPLVLSELPERVWRPVLAAEDSRFFDHIGLDGRSLARAALANVKAGGVEQGGSTITQQLVKNRDLTPRRTFKRKLSEALRALALEAEYDKQEILEAYLNQVYLGHVDGLAIHGFGAAARAYFSKPASELKLAEAALLAGMIQGPNRLAPMRHPQRARQRRDWVLGRMEQLGWASPDELERARRSDLGTRPGRVERPAARHFLGWVAQHARRAAPGRVERGRGVVVETTLDPYLQQLASRAVERHLAELRRGHRTLRDSDLSAALIALDARTGAVLAYVGGDPATAEDRFDRARNGKRQPGSAIKPLLLLESFQTCGKQQPLNPATRVADEPMRIDLPGGPWEPENYDGRFHGVVDVRTAARHSYNVPFVRLARWCGFEATASRIRRAGLEIPDDPPPSFALGALETSPLALAGAYTVFGTPGSANRPFGIRRIERPGGRSIERNKPSGTAVVHPSTAYLVRDLMRDAVENGTGRRAAVPGLEVAGKTGTSSSLRDAWFAGHADGLITVVWIGRDGGGRLGLSGGVAAAPLWREFMREAAPARPVYRVQRPRDVETHRVDPDTGLRVGDRSSRGRDELFRGRALPRRARFWRRDRATPVIR